jgi:hypothetical protein
MKKQKKFGRQLKLNKDTIASLNSSSTAKVIGGNPVPPPGSIHCRPVQEPETSTGDC